MKTRQGNKDENKAARDKDLKNRNFKPLSTYFEGLHDFHLSNNLPLCQATRIKGAVCCDDVRKALDARMRHSVAQSFIWP